MTKKIVKKIDLNGQDWFDGLVEDVKGIMGENIKIYREVLIKAYHELGKRILEENDNFKRSRIYGKEIVKQVAQSVRMGERMIYYGIRFYKKFPDLNQFLSSVSEGENISMRKIIMRYLTEPDKAREERVKNCGHYQLKCNDCGRTVKKVDLCEVR